ncbi:hypothetical protein F1880_005989 [Penicillium rolfsii]|nr:hypothetical protein F1880_005989 [Penicillium rolfsii]
MTTEQTRTAEADLLDHTIDALSEVKLRQVFKTVCKNSPEARKQAEKLLLASEYTQGDKGSSAKQLVPRFAFCENCEQEFDVTTNSSTSCRYHTMEDEPDECLYEDNPTNIWDPDSEEAREEFPEFFTFKCCGRTREANQPGCTVDWHKEMMSEDKPAKRIRVESI